MNKKKTKRESKLLKYFYTLSEIAIALNYTLEQRNAISFYARTRDLDKIIAAVPDLSKFKAYLQYMTINGKGIYVINAEVFDLYLETGILKDLGEDLKEADINKKEYWQYNSSSTFEFNTKDEWDFGIEYFKNKDSNIEQEDIWNIFLAGCARMDYEQEKSTPISQRIKYALMEYMIKRPQFFNSNDYLYDTSE